MIRMIKIMTLLFCCFILACSGEDDFKNLDKSKLKGSDYRLFYNTPAWDLAKAIKEDNYLKISEILKTQKEIINFQEPIYGNTLLMLTVENQQRQAFEMLLKANADISIHDKFNGSSALIEACSSKLYDIEFIKILLENGAAVNDVETGPRRQGNSKRYTPLLAAAETGRIDFIDLLLQKGANINWINENKQSALSLSMLTDNYNIVNYLLIHGADFRNPLFYRENEKRDIYIQDLLRETLLDLDSDDYKYKKQIIEFLRTKGIEYNSLSIPEWVKKQAQEDYPNNWEEYLSKY